MNTKKEKLEHISPKHSLIPKEWLTKKITIQELENERPIDLKIDGFPLIDPNAGWEELRNQMNETDELWRYSSPCFNNIEQFHGIALVRNGIVIDYIETFKFLL